MFVNVVCSDLELAMVKPVRPREPAPALKYHAVTSPQEPLSESPVYVTTTQQWAIFDEPLVGGLFNLHTIQDHLDAQYIRYAIDMHRCIIA